MKYLKCINEGFYNNVDFSLIEDIKDMALEYIDDGLTLRVEGYNVGIGYIDYILIFNHEINKEKICGDYKLSLDYYLYIFNDRMVDGYSYIKTKELVNRAGEAYPNHCIKIPFWSYKNKLELK